MGIVGTGLTERSKRKTPVGVFFGVWRLGAWRCEEKTPGGVFLGMSQFMPWVVTRSLTNFGLYVTVHAVGCDKEFF
jgi:hypothetical protein